MKREAKVLDGTPDKRLFWSIIQDYDLETSICELTDNALDLYLRNKQTTPIFMKIDLDVDRQLIRIKDDAGGVRESQLELLVKSGGTGNNRDQRNCSTSWIRRSSSRRPRELVLLDEARLLDKHISAGLMK